MIQLFILSYVSFPLIFYRLTPSFDMITPIGHVEVTDHAT